MSFQRCYANCCTSCSAGLGRPYQPVLRFSVFFSERENTELQGGVLKRVVLRSVRILNGRKFDAVLRRLSGERHGTRPFFRRFVFRTVLCGTENGTGGHYGTEFGTGGVCLV